MTHVNYTKLENNTIQGGKVNHIGQIYFDQDLVDQVEKTAPYNMNQQVQVKNNQDFLLAQGASGGADPVLEYVVIGNKLENGVFGWINFGIDSKSSRNVYAAANCDAEGCKSGKGMLGGLAGLFDGFMPKGKGFGAPSGAMPPGGGSPGSQGLFPPGMSFPTGLFEGFGFPKGLEAFFPKGGSPSPNPAPKSQ
jgi:hypothetical protein